MGLGQKHQALKDENLRLKKEIAKEKYLCTKSQETLFYLARLALHPNEGFEDLLQRVRKIELEAKEEGAERELEAEAVLIKIIEGQIDQQKTAQAKATLDAAGVVVNVNCRK